MTDPATVTIAEVLADTGRRFHAAVVGDVRLEAEVLLAHSLGIDRAHLLARLGEPFQPVSALVFESLVRRRVQREPLAYIMGRREFYGIEFACTRAALIPRPELET